MCVRVFMRVCAYVCVRARVHACVCACVHWCHGWLSVFLNLNLSYFCARSKKDLNCFSMVVTCHMRPLPNGLRKKS